MKNLIIHIILFLSSYTSTALNEPLKVSLRNNYSEKGKNLVSPPIISASNCNGELTKIFDKRFGSNSSDYLRSMISTSEGGYILAGISDGFISGDKVQNPKGNNDYWIVKIDSLGNKIWDKTFGGTDFDDLEIIIPTSDGGYLLGGQSISGTSGDKTQNSQGSYDYWIIKIDNSGNKLWDKRFGGDGDDQLRSITPTNDGGYLLGGWSLSQAFGDKTQSSRGNWDYWILKIDNSGNKLWDKRFGGSDMDLLGGIISTSDGGYLLSGISLSGYSGDKTSSCLGNGDYWIVKIDDMGNKIWDIRLGGNDSELEFTITRIVQTVDGGYLIGGSSQSGISGEKTQNCQGYSDYWVVKIDNSGSKLWDKRFGGSNIDFLSAITLTNDGGFFLGGWSTSGISGDKSQVSKGVYDYWVVKIDGNGNKIWDKTIGGNSNDWMYSIIFNNDGSYLLGGASSSGISGDRTQATRGGFDYWIVKVKECQNNSIFCSNTPVYLTATGCTGTINWSTGALGSTLTVNASETTTITATCTVAGSTSINSNEIVITKPTIPSILNANPSAICMGESITLSSNNCLGGAVSWSSGGTGANITINPTLTNSYFSFCTINGCKSSNSNPLIVNVATTPFMYTLKSGTWNDNTVWSCGKVPSITDSITIISGHTITINTGEVYAKDLKLEGILNYLNNAKLKLKQ